MNGDIIEEDPSEDEEDHDVGDGRNTSFDNDTTT
jgi:hypothetical protein